MRYICLFIVFIAISVNLWAQKNEQVYDTLKIFNPQREYRYSALYTNEKGDTISSSVITISPTGEAWVQKTQTAIIVTYAYTSADSVRFISYEVNPKVDRAWITTDRTGAIERDSSVWMHPFRCNQYMLTEVAPFPEVALNKKEGDTWGKILLILSGWGIFKGKVVVNYEINQVDCMREYNFGLLDDCIEITSNSVHKKLGTSYLTSYFCPQVGFSEMYYTFYNGHKMEFILQEVLENENK